MSLETADIQSMSLDPQAQDPGEEYQTPREQSADPSTDEQDPATPGGASPYNGAEPFSQPVSSDPMWSDPSDPDKKPRNSATPYLGPGPSVETTTLHSARLGPMEENMSSTLWAEASRDVETEQDQARMVQAKVSTSAIWPFLSVALTEREFSHRMALCQETLEEMFPDSDFRSRVAVSLNEDYLILKGATLEELHPELTRTASTPEPEPERDPSAVAGGLWTMAATEPEEAPAGDGAQGPLDNPANDDTTPEAGPNTGADGQFAQFPAGPDPWNPMNAQYPMQPGKWVVPPDKGWVERPMQFGKQSAAEHPDHATHYRAEGVETGFGPNPEFFAAGGEGVGGDGQTGFPADVTLPEPDVRSDMYGTVPPGPSQPAQPVSYSNTPKQAYRVADDRAQQQRSQTQRNNHGSCTQCNRPVYRHGGEWKHLEGDPSHGVFLSGDHPWVQEQYANRVAAAKRTAEYKYVKPNPDGDGFVITQKGTGKILSHHESEEDAQAAFRAMMTHKHDAARVARFVVAEAEPETATPSGGDPSTPASPEPQSMQQGGAGSMAMPPLTIPNDQNGSNPFSPGQNNPGTAAPAPGVNNPFQAVRREAEVRERPGVFNTSGVPDEFTANTWDNPAKQRPLQNSTDRGINTPQQPGKPIDTITSEDQQQEEQRDEEER
jgi:hypothetical protein